MNKAHPAQKSDGGDRYLCGFIACIDGYQMTLKGKTGFALFTAGLSSFIGGTVAIVCWLGMLPAR
jgi:TctA family transporter